MEYTNRRNANRGYMRLEVWNEALDLFGYVHTRLGRIDKIDFRLKGQLLDSTQSISANIAEGYCRRTLNEYLQYLNIALVLKQFQQRVKIANMRLQREHATELIRIGVGNVGERCGKACAKYA